MKLCKAEYDYKNNDRPLDTYGIIKPHLGKHRIAKTWLQVLDEGRAYLDTIEVSKSRRGFSRFWRQLFI